MLFMIDIYCYTSQDFDWIKSKVVPSNSASALDTTLLDCIVLLVVLALANRSQHFPEWLLADCSSFPVSGEIIFTINKIYY